MPVPSIFSYLDHRAFLKDWIQERKQSDPDYSYAAFARAGNCSKAAVSNVLNGSRTPRPDTLDAFARAMELGPAERNYLGLLVELQSAPTLASRHAVLERIFAVERYGKFRRDDHVPESDVTQFLEFWWVPVIRELASLSGFRDDPEWVANLLRPKISVQQARAAIDTLLDLGFLERRGDRLEPSEMKFEAFSESSRQAVRQYHSEVVPERLRTLDRDMNDQQLVIVSTTTVPTAMIPEFKRRIENLVRRLATMSDDQTTDGPHRVFQLSVQLFPVTEELE